MKNIDLVECAISFAALGFGVFLLSVSWVILTRVC